MARMTPFDSPFLLGFDRIERLLDRAAKGAEGYPPYNIERLGENRIRITLAVAGFSMDELDVSLEDAELVIRGRQAPETEGEERVFLYRGIAARQFQRNFVLAEGIEVTGASLENGLLHVDLVRKVSEPEIKSIPIQAGAGTKGPGTLTLEAEPTAGGPKRRG